MEKLDPLMSSARTGDKSKDEWETPDWLYNILYKEFHFTLDPAATARNTKCRHFFYKDESGGGLIYSWESHVVWLNPPYSSVAEWYKKAYAEAFRSNATVVMLVAARTDTRYWWDYARLGEVRFLKGRLKFEGGKHSAPFPSAVVVFHKGMNRSPQTVYWDIHPSTERT